MNLEDEVKNLRRDVGHLTTVMATQREVISKALQDVQMTLIEQEVTLRSQLQKILDTLEKVAARVDEQENWRVDVEERLERLEQDRPPAA